MKIIRSDGGFAMLSISNQSESFAIVSNTNIFIIKTDSDLKQQWTRQYRTTYPATGYDIIETRDGGYAIGAFERTFNINSKMMIVKTDANCN